MKKILSVIAVLTLVLAFSAPALASEEPGYEINYIPSATYEVSEADTEDGVHVEIRKANPADVDEGELIKTAESSDSVKPEDISGFDIVDIVPVRDSDGTVIDTDKPITICFTYDKGSDLVATFVQNEDGTWEEFDFTLEGEILTLYLPHAGPVSFTLKEKNPLPPVEPTPAQPGSTVKGSPQTGDHTVLWAVLAAALAVGACVSFAAARKKA